MNLNRRGATLLLAGAVWTVAAQEMPRVLYVAPHGSASGDGSFERPLDLATAIGPRSPARPGDTILLRGGTYRGQFSSVLTGAEGRPIVVRQYAGERATLDPSLTIRGAWTWYWGFEVTNSDPDRTRQRPDGVTVLGANTRLINLVVHDCGNGVGLWSAAAESEMYGCIVYGNGWQLPPPGGGHGHSLYTQNETGVKRVVDNILFRGYAYGIHAYAEGGALKGLHFEGNIIFDSGFNTTGQRRQSNLLAGGRTPADRVTIVSNYTYHPPAQGGTVLLGYSSGPPNGELVARDNYFIGGPSAAAIYYWRSAVVTGNTFAAPWMVELRTPKDLTYSYEIDRNTYLYTGRGQAFSMDGRGYDLAAWQAEFGYDRNSQWVNSGQGRPAGTKVFFRPNQYEPGRIHIAVYNFDLKPQVEVDLKGLLEPGSSYEVRNVVDLFGPPVATGLYNGQSIALPMTGTDAGPEFNAYLLTGRRATLPPRLRRGQ